MEIRRKINNRNVEEREIDSEGAGFEWIGILNLKTNT